MKLLQSSNYVTRRQSLKVTLDELPALQNESLWIPVETEPRAPLLCLAPGRNAAGSQQRESDGQVRVRGTPFNADDDAPEGSVKEHPVWGLPRLQG